MFLRFETISRLPLVMRGKGESAAAYKPTRAAASRSLLRNLINQPAPCGIPPSGAQTTADALPPLGSAGFSFHDSALAPATGAGSATAPDLSDPSDAVAVNSNADSAGQTPTARSEHEGRSVDRMLPGVAVLANSVSAMTAEGVAAVAANSDNGETILVGARGPRFITESRPAGSPLWRESAGYSYRSRLDNPRTYSDASIPLPTGAALEAFKITQPALDVLFPVFALLFVQLCAFAVIVFIIGFFMR